MIQQFHNISEDEINRQNRLTPLLSKKMPEIIIDNYSISLIEHHWITISQQRNFHTHRFLEIHVPYLGQGRIITKNQQAYYKPGTFTVTPPSLPHSWECVESPLYMQVWWLIISPVNKKLKEQSSSYNDLIIENLRSASALTYLLHPSFFNAYDLMLQEVDQYRPGSEIMLESLFKQIIILLARAIKPEHKPDTFQQNQRPGKLSNRMLLSRVDEFIQSNLNHELTLDEIASHIGISPRNLTRRYKKTRSQTIWQTIAQMRMTKARILLQSSNLSIFEIAERCGIYNKYYFSTMFSKHFGKSPSSFRKEMKTRKDDD